VERVLFVPFSLAAGFIAAYAGKTIFERIWALIDDQEPPEPENRDVSLAKLALALAIEGAIFRGVRGMVDHGARRSFARATGAWPGEGRPERA
jgi:hypothetical protein